MSTPLAGPLANGLSIYLAHKRALGKRLEKTEPTLHWLDHYLVEQGVTGLSQITSAHLEGFLKSRPRRTGCPRISRTYAKWRLTLPRAACVVRVSDRRF
jgi:hypothetical protein